MIRKSQINGTGLEVFTIMEYTGLISAVITTHNRKELLLKAIDSVLDQTYKNMECIVIDDASTDGTDKLISDKYDNDTVIYYKFDKSVGGNVARNKGIELAKGEWVAFLDDDDEWFPEKTERQLQMVDSKTGFVYCGLMREVNMDTSTWNKQKINNETVFPSGNLSNAVLTHIITNTSTMMIKRDLLNQIGGFDVNVRYWQEYEMSIRILQLTEAAVVREPLVLYRILTNDKQRLSNNINGWENSVKYIENKHAKLFARLNKKEKALRELYVCIDGIGRARKCRSYYKLAKYYALIIFRPQVLRQVVIKMRKRK